MTLDIPLLDGKVEHAEVEQFGALAVHETTRKKGGWRITHIATAKAIPVICCTREHAVSLVGKLAPLDWELKDDQVPGNLRKSARCILNTHFAACLECHSFTNSLFPLIPQEAA